MKELLRIVHGCLDDVGGDTLRDYNVEIYEGDILYIQGIEDSGIRTLAKVFAGDCALKGGSLFLNGKKVEDYDRNTAYYYRIYTITAEQDLVETMSVAENLEAVRHLPSSWRLYNRKRSERDVNAYLRKEQVNIRADENLWMLSQTERKKLSILKANMHGARLIILDATRGIYEGKEAEEICGLIRRANEEGITFVILSRCYTLFAEIANRIQILSAGIDLKEWGRIDNRIRLCLRRPAGTAAESGEADPAEREPVAGAAGQGTAAELTEREADAVVRADMAVRDGMELLKAGKAGEVADGRDKTKTEIPLSAETVESANGFLGMYDYEWEMEDGIWHYLSFVQRQNPAFWDREVRAHVPEPGSSFCLDTAVIPANSGESLVGNLDITDNLLLPIPQRAGRGPGRVIRLDIRRNIADKFYRTTGIRPDIEQIDELNRIQRKILSIYRWELAHPNTMILESPYSGLTLEETLALRTYLQGAAERGIRILYFSKTPDDMREDCEKVILTQNGKNAKIATVSQIFPPQNEGNF
ncbi:MAG: ATP-binding cassette domain-containing protein [Lachnospiraceae bacterium]|nr:ATP-binding cassette domain-containing protein [Lachnospiraceae bacterium]